MPSPRNTILGKRPHQSSADSTLSSNSACALGHGLYLLTSDPTPDAKRPRISATQTDDDSNKENIPPFVGKVINGRLPRSTRSLRRTTSSSSTRSRNAPREDPIPESAERAKKFLPTPTLTLLTKKVVSQTGDVRATFEVLRGAIDLAVTATVTPDSLGMPAPVVIPSHILSALKAHSPAAASARLAEFTSVTAPTATATVTSRPVDSEIVAKVHGLSLQQHLVLLVMVLARKRLDAGLTLSGSLTASSPSPLRSPIKRTVSMIAAASPRKTASPSPSTSMDTTQLYAVYSEILTRSDAALFAPVSHSEFCDLLGVLETVGLVLLSSTGGMPGTPSKMLRKDLRRITSFNAGKCSQDVHLVETVRTEEVARGLGIATGADASNEASAAVDVRKEEVCTIWEREHARIARETKAMARAAKPADVFEDAMEA